MKGLDEQGEPKYDLGREQLENGMILSGRDWKLVIGNSGKSRYRGKFQEV